MKINRELINFVLLLTFTFGLFFSSARLITHNNFPVIDEKHEKFHLHYLGLKEKVYVQKKMLNSLTSYGIPAELLSDPDSGVNGSSMTDMINDLSTLMRPTELTSLLRGNATPEVLTIIVNYIDMNIPALSEYLSSENSIQDFL